jgi:CRISPR-associated exonuclease Cas4
MGLVIVGIGFALATGIWAVWRFRKLRSRPKIPLYRGENAGKLRQQMVSWEYGLTGSPDYVVDHNGQPIPVLKKSGQAPDHEPHDSHVAQILVHCLLVHETMQSPPPYGVIRYDDRTFEVDYTEQAVTALLELVDEMRGRRQADTIPARSHDSRQRCYACRYRGECEESLV